MLSFFRCPICLGTQKRVAPAPKPRQRFLWGTERISPFFFSLAASIRHEIVSVVPQKAERTRVPGAGFSPEAVPGKAGSKDRTARIGQPLILDSSRNRSDHLPFSRLELVRCSDAKEPRSISGTSKTSLGLSPFAVRCCVRAVVFLKPCCFGWYAAGRWITIFCLLRSPKPFGTSIDDPGSSKVAARASSS